MRKTADFLYSKFKKRHNSFKNRCKLTTLKLALQYIKRKLCAKFQLNVSEHAGENCGKTVYFLYSKFKKRHNSFKNLRKVTTLKLDLEYINTKSCAKFQLKMTKHVGEKCGKLHISYILSSQRRHNSFKNWCKVMTLELDL